MRKPQIKILRNEDAKSSRRWLFLVKFPGRAYRDSVRLSFEDALIAAGVKRP